MKLSRRLVLRGVGGTTLGLPFLESFPGQAKAAATDQSFAIFFRQANGVSCGGSTSFGSEPDRFWPKQGGALSANTIAGQALDELTPYVSRLLVVRADTRDFQFDCGHARGAFQCLTANGPNVPGVADFSEANGESLDNRIGRELNAGGRDSLYLYAGQSDGYLGGACISHRGPAQRRAAIANPWTAYQTVTGGASMPVAGMATSSFAQRQKSVNDLVRGELNALISNPRLSSSDKKRLDLHLSSVRDLEASMGCLLATDRAKTIETGSGIFDSNNGEDRITIAQFHLDVATLAVSCGQNRAVTLQMGSGNDPTQFLDPDTGMRYESFHYISHRVQSDGADGTLIAGADVQHHKIDRYFGKMFKYLLDKLDAIPAANGGTLLDQGVAAWFNDLGNGPGHSAKNVPWVLAGSANGTLKKGQYIDATGSDSNHAKLLRAIGIAIGMKTPVGSPLDDFGDPTFEKGHLTQLFV